MLCKHKRARFYTRPRYLVVICTLLAMSCTTNELEKESICEVICEDCKKVTLKCNRKIDQESKEVNTPQ